MMQREQSSNACTQRSQPSEPVPVSQEILSERKLTVEAHAKVEVHRQRLVLLLARPPGGGWELQLAQCCMGFVKGSFKVPCRTL